MCKKCGCNTCDTESTALVLNESKVSATILSEGLKHHIDTNKPLTEHLYRAGSRAYFDLIAEARSLYSRDILEFTNEDDLAILTETDLGHFGMFEGKKVPLDFPIELNEDEMDNMSINESDSKYPSFEVNKNIKYQDTIVTKGYWTYTGKESGGRGVYKNVMNNQMLGLDMDDLNYFKKHLPDHFDISENKIYELVNEAVKKKKGKNANKPIGKPMRDTSGGKAYKVYVKDPKTKKVKTVRFGSGGLRAKINDSKARAAFAARHKCSTKKDRTKAGYWSCRLPRYAKLLGLKSSFSGFW